MKKKKLIKLIIAWCLIICTTITGCSIFNDEESSGSSKRKNEGYIDVEELISSFFDLKDREDIAYGEPEETQEAETTEPQTEPVSAEPQTEPASEEQPSTEQHMTEAVTTEVIETEPATNETTQLRPL